jgi:hypothetical protein
LEKYFNIFYLNGVILAQKRAKNDFVIAGALTDALFVW